MTEVDRNAAADTTAPLEITGPWFEDFHRGLEFDAPAVTITEGLAAQYQALFGDRLRLPLDHHASRAISGDTAPLAHPLLAINVAVGQSTWASQRVKANLFYRGLLLQRPVRLGDTLHTRTRVVGLRQNRVQAGRAATGIVALPGMMTGQILSGTEPIIAVRYQIAIMCAITGAVAITSFLLLLQGYRQYFTAAHQLKESDPQAHRPS